MELEETLGSDKQPDKPQEKDDRIEIPATTEKKQKTVSEGRHSSESLNSDYDKKEEVRANRSEDDNKQDSTKSKNVISSEKLPPKVSRLSIGQQSTDTKKLKEKTANEKSTADKILMEKKSSQALHPEQSSFARNKTLRAT